MMLNGVGEGELSCPQFPLTPPSRSLRLPSFSYYSCVSVGGERCMQRPCHARSTAFIFRFLQKREGERSFQHSPSRSAHQLSPSSGNARGNHHWMFAPHALRRAGVLRNSPVLKEDQALCAWRFDEMRRT